MQLISRMAVEYAHQMVESDGLGSRLSGIIERLDVPPVRLSLDLMSDHAAARALAAAVYRALLRRVGP